MLHGKCAVCNTWICGDCGKNTAYQCNSMRIKQLEEQIEFARKLQRTFREYKEYTSSIVDEGLYDILEEFCNLANEKIIQITTNRQITY